MSVKQTASLLLALALPLVLAGVCDWIVPGDGSEWFSIVVVGYLALILFLVVDWLNRHMKAIAACILMPFLLVPFSVNRLIRLIVRSLIKTITDYMRFRL